MTDVETAEATLADLRDKRSRLFDRAKELAQTRQEVSYAAHTGDELAREALDKCIAEIIAHDHEVETLRQPSRRPPIALKRLRGLWLRLLIVKPPSR